MSDEQKHQIVTKKLNELRLNLLKTFNFIIQKVDPLLEFMDAGIKEVKDGCCVELMALDTVITQIRAFLNKFRRNCEK